MNDKPFTHLDQAIIAAKSLRLQVLKALTTSLTSLLIKYSIGNITNFYYYL